MLCSPSKPNPETSREARTSPQGRACVQGKSLAVLMLLEEMFHRPVDPVYPPSRDRSVPVTHPHHPNPIRGTPRPFLHQRVQTAPTIAQRPHQAQAVQVSRRTEEVQQHIVLGCIRGPGSSRGHGRGAPLVGFCCCRIRRTYELGPQFLMMSKFTSQCPGLAFRTK